MIDTHAHVTKRFAEDVNNIIEGAKKNGISKIILAASNLEESKENIKLAYENNIFAACIGIHPQQTDPEIILSIDEQIDELDKLAEENRKLVVAIGECGLDATPPPPEEKERSTKDQERLFRGQIAVALKHKLPIVVHSRKTVDEVVSILSEYPELKGVVHCYTGGKKRIQKVLDLGNFYFGIDGNLTYEDGLAEVVANIPKDRLLLETDSPFLSPVPHRGEICKPEYIRFTYQKVAEIWKMNIEETEKMIDGNARRLFRL